MARALTHLKVSCSRKLRKRIIHNMGSNFKSCKSKALTCYKSCFVSEITFSLNFLASHQKLPSRVPKLSKKFTFTATKNLTPGEH